MDYYEVIPSANILLGYPEAQNIFFCVSGNKFGSLEDLWAPSSIKKLCHISN